MERQERENEALARLVVESKQYRLKLQTEEQPVWFQYITNHYAAVQALQLEAANSPKKAVPCSVCGGTGESSTCLLCGGDGKCPTCKGTKTSLTFNGPCPPCLGKGNCFLCRGTGRMNCPLCEDGIIRDHMPPPPLEIPIE
jgi:hypothetical protein